MTNTLPQQTYAVIAKHLKVSEREIRWPYLDTKGNVTIGVGFKTDSEDAFAKLDLYTVRNDKTVPATDAEKRSAFRRMEEIREERNGDFNHGANFYAEETQVVMPLDAIDEKLRTEIEIRTAKIRQEVGDKAWNRLNDEQKAAVIDVGYANGDGSLKGFKNFKQAIIDGKPQIMADESTFYTNSETGERDLFRLQRNYQALSGLEPEESTKR